MSAIAARVAGAPVSVDDVDARERLLRATGPAAALPLAGTSEGRQLRRWVTQLIVTERVLAFEAARLGIRADGAPPLTGVLPDAAARLEVGSVIAAALADPLARSLFDYVTADVTVADDEVARYHAGNPMRFAGHRRSPQGWRIPGPCPRLDQVRTVIADHLLAAARRRVFRNWLDARRATLVELAPGYEHPGDPRQPDNVHRH
jgi:[acyl-carrier-protein] S-malonyltransferase